MEYGILTLLPIAVVVILALLAKRTLGTSDCRLSCGLRHHQRLAFPLRLG